jgi:hypothetical protein
MQLVTVRVSTGVKSARNCRMCDSPTSTRTANPSYARVSVAHLERAYALIDAASTKKAKKEIAKEYSVTLLKVRVCVRVLAVTYRAQSPLLDKRLLTLYACNLYQCFAIDRLHFGLKGACL